MLVPLVAGGRGAAGEGGGDEGSARAMLPWARTCTVARASCASARSWLERCPSTRLVLSHPHPRGNAAEARTAWAPRGGCAPSSPRSS